MAVSDHWTGHAHVFAAARTPGDARILRDLRVDYGSKKGAIVASNSGQTGSKAASDAAKTLADSGSAGSTSVPAEKSAAASALSQAPESKGETGSKAASAAAKTLGDPDSTEQEKSAAASALGQTPEDPDKNE